MRLTPSWRRFAGGYSCRIRENARGSLLLYNCKSQSASLLRAADGLALGRVVDEVEEERGQDSSKQLSNL